MTLNRLCTTLLLAALPAFGAIVANTNDSGAGSLRDAIVNSAAIDTITFAPGVTGTITLLSALPDLTKNLTISGPGASNLAISGNNAVTVFRIVSGVTVA